MMMMAPDSTPKPQISPAARAALQKALERFLADESDVAALQTSLQELAAEARGGRMHAEQLLVTLKDVWFGLPQVRSAGDVEKQNRLLQRVVTLCIREYYAR